MMSLMRVVAGLCVCFMLAEARPYRPNRPSRPPKPGRLNAINYLRKYNYLGAGNPDPGIKELEKKNMSMAVEVGVRMFQSKWNLPVTGEIDSVTARKMKVPRCGMPDIEVMEDMPNMEDATGAPRGHRHRRYMLQGSSWDRDILYYRISEYTNDLPKEQIDNEIERAFSIWSDVTPLRFIQVHEGHVDINIRFTPRVHGDGFDFDGAGGTLAHAFYPRFGGATHFDDSERWTIETYEGINLLQVAAHEFGHALGLRHSEMREALMYPFYSGYYPDFTLPDDDVAGIQAIYGPNEEPSEPTEQPTRTPETPNICQDGMFDAVTTTAINGEAITHVFRGDYYMQLDEYGVLEGFPRLIAADWTGASRVDAALTMEYEIYDGAWYYKAVTYLFSGQEYYTFVNMVLRDHGFISDDWGLPSNLDAVFQWGANGLIHAIKGDEVYTLSSSGDRRYPDEDSPRSLVRTWGVGHVDAATMSLSDDYRRETSFFSGDLHYLIDDATQTVAPGYPRRAVESWLRC